MGCGKLLLLYRGILPQVLINTGNNFQGVLPEIHGSASLGTVFTEIIPPSLHSHSEDMKTVSGYAIKKNQDIVSANIYIDYFIVA